MNDSLKFSDAWERGGYRERTAMEKGQLYSWKDRRGHIMWRFTYSSKDEYQDANGATFDVTEGVWVN